MGSVDWQSVVAVSLVVAAIGVVARRTIRMWSSRLGGGCGTGGCGSCPSNAVPLSSGSQPGEIVELESLMAREEPREKK